MATLLALPGLAATSPQFRAALVQMAQRNGWDADAIATVISIESGFDPRARSPLPGQTATGLIQFTDATAKGLGVVGGADAVREMSAVEQLDLVEKYYRRAFQKVTPRAVDFYLAGWGSGIGQPGAHVLARESDPRKFNGGRDNLYTLNRGLDANKNGEITVADIEAKMVTRQAQAGGRRLDVPLVSTPSPPPPVASVAPVASGSEPSSLGLRSRSLVELSQLLPAVAPGSSGPLVGVLEFFAGAPITGSVGAFTDNALRSLQRKLAERGHYTGKIDGQFGPRSWRALFEAVRL